MWKRLWRSGGAAAVLAVALVVGAAAGCIGIEGELEGDPAPGATGEGAARAPGEAGPAADTRAPSTTPRRLRAEVVATYPHDTGAYTQGLLLDPADRSVLLESTGQYGRSELRRVDLATGTPIRRVSLGPDLFGEGLAHVPAAGDRPARLVQLTWQAGIAKLWDPATFEPLGEHRYSGEGWGLCYDPSGGTGAGSGAGSGASSSSKTKSAGRLVMSNGSPWLAFRDPATFAETGGVTVRLGGRPVAGLNELECVGGRVWANVYGSELLVEIDPATGTVTTVAEASGLLSPDERPGTDVFNGIAHDPTNGTFLVTGKDWPKLFRVRLVEE